MKSKTLLTLLAAAFIFTGCSKDAQDGNGRLRIRFSADPAVTETTTRALELTAPGVEEFSLRVVKSDGTYDRSWDDITRYPGEGYFIKAGSYTAEALYGDIEQEGFGAACFGVEKVFTVVDQVTSNVEMTARLRNMAVTVERTDGFIGYFPTSNVEIMREEDLIVDFSENPAGTAFIKPEAFRVKLNYTLQDNGGARVYSQEFDVTDNVGPCTHMRILFDVNRGEVGNVSIEVIFSDDLETIVWPVIEAGDED